MVKFALLKPALAICGLSVALAGCSTSAQPGSRVTRFLSIQPIQVCDDFGQSCADLALFMEETLKIWAQADIQINFLPPNRLFSSRFLTIESRNEFSELSFSGGPGSFGRNPLSSCASGPINMWFVEDITQGSLDVFGLAWIDQNGVLISDNILDFNRGIGRRDTVAHEIGHNLGLTHSNFGAGPSTNLMSDGRGRSIPSSVDDIAPDGARLSRLTNDQADFARDSRLIRTTSTLPSCLPIPSPNLEPFFLDGDAIQIAHDAVPKALTTANERSGENLTTAPSERDVISLTPQVAIAPDASTPPKVAALPRSIPEPDVLPRAWPWLSGGLLLGGILRMRGQEANTHD